MVKKALCVGVNYPNQEYQLHGCVPSTPFRHVCTYEVNDCLDWERTLKENFALEERNFMKDGVSFFIL